MSINGNAGIVGSRFLIGWFTLSALIACLQVSAREILVETRRTSDFKMVSSHNYRLVLFGLICLILLVKVASRC